MGTFSEIASVVSKLTLTELTELERVIRHELEQRRDRTSADPSPRPRVLGLHQGAWTVAEDFDAPLPDEFWLGKEV